MQRGRTQTPAAAGFDSLSPSRFASGPADHDSDSSDESDDEVPFPTDGPLAAGLKHNAGQASDGSPSKGGLLRRLGALRRSVSPAKKGTTATAGEKKSPQKPVPAPGSSGDATPISVAAPALSRPQQTTPRPHDSRPRVGGTAAAGRDLQGFQLNGGDARAARSPKHAQPHGRSAGSQRGAQEAPFSERPSMVRRDSAAARVPETGSRHATSATAGVSASIVRSASNASSLATDTTAASGVSSGLGNARTAADSYGGSVFASALNQEAGLQLLNQVRHPCGSVAGPPERCAPCGACASQVAGGVTVQNVSLQGCWRLAQKHNACAGLGGPGTTGEARWAAAGP